MALYQLGLALALLVAGPFLLLARGRHYLPTLRGRLGLALPSGPESALWLHAVSVGEVSVAAVLARALPAELPLVVTTITPTGQQRARALLGERAGIGYLPIDLGPQVERFLRRLRPAALVLVEGDYWPLLLARCRRRKLRIAVVNGRVGDRTLRLLAPRPRIARWLLGAVERFAVQTAEDARRLHALGVAAEKVVVAGNLKYDAAEPAPQRLLEGALLAAAAGRRLLVAGSTMPGEEQVVLDAFAAIGGGERALLVLAPRHPERWEETARLLADGGWRWQRRSAMTDREVATPPDVVLLDSLGELAALYRLAAACFVGGTLAPTGGHNPLEPARFGRAIAVGPSMHNFRDMAVQFDEALAWRRVADAAELAAAWRSWLEDPAAAAALGARARALVEVNRGAVERTLQVIAPLLARVGAPEALPPAAEEGARSPSAADAEPHPAAGRSR
jgi:3-deoxy-D-manno-octulosonic-acid transferase